VGDLIERFGTAKRPGRPVERARVGRPDDATVEAVGELSKALEIVEAARGFLYQFHRMSGTADLTLQRAVGRLRAAGHAAIADEIEQVLVGRDVVDGRWTFELVDSYDEQYWSVFRATEESVRARLAGGVKHVFEAEMKHGEQS
jgi:hypothetical protein